MKVVGIVAEYNPFHNGHKFHIEEAKKVTNSDYCICIMSGSFTQTGNIAIIDKFKRAKSACENGCDLVIELPSIYVNSSAENFAFGAINTLASLGIVDSICFGSESNDISSLTNISNKILKNEDKIWKITKESLNEGMSFSKARLIALSTFLNENELNIISNPNDILGLEYINTINRLNLNIQPYTILRNSSSFNEVKLNNSNKYTSASSIRNTLCKEKNIKNIQNYIPENLINMLNDSTLINNNNMYSIIKYKIITSKLETLKDINEINEGLQNKIITEINNSKNYDEFVNNIKSKRYKLSKIKRMLNNMLLGITKEDFEYAKNKKIGYAHILAYSKNGKNLISSIVRSSTIPIITSINDNVIKNLDKDIQKYLKFDLLASDIHSVISNESIKKDYTNRL